MLLDIPRDIITEESDVKSRSRPFSNGNGFLLRDKLIDINGKDGIDPGEVFDKTSYLKLINCKFNNSFYSLKDNQNFDSIDFIHCCFKRSVNFIDSELDNISFYSCTFLDEVNLNISLKNQLIFQDIIFRSKLILNSKYSFIGKILFKKVNFYKKRTYEFRELNFGKRSCFY